MGWEPLCTLSNQLVFFRRKNTLFHLVMICEVDKKDHAPVSLTVLCLSRSFFGEVLQEELFLQSPLRVPAKVKGVSEGLGEAGRPRPAGSQPAGSDSGVTQHISLTCGVYQDPHWLFSILLPLQQLLT